VSSMIYSCRLAHTDIELKMLFNWIYSLFIMHANIINKMSYNPSFMLSLQSISSSYVSTSSATPGFQIALLWLKNKMLHCLCRCMKVCVFFGLTESFLW
jgi:hypothetical protein